MNRRGFLRSAFVTAAAVTGLARARIEPAEGVGAEPVTGSDFGRHGGETIGVAQSCARAADGTLVATIDFGAGRPYRSGPVVCARLKVRARNPVEPGQLVYFNYEDGTVG